MKIKVQVVVESEGKECELLKTISHFEGGSLRPEELGLTLKEAKDLLKGIQQVMVETQTEEYLEQREAISTGFVESTVNQVVSKRFVKKQQMRWSPKGAHLLLQVRTKVLNEELREKFNHRYPGFEKNREAAKMAA